MQDYIRYLDGENKEWRLIVKDYELDGNIQASSLEKEIEFAKETRVGVCVDLSLVDKVQESAYAILANWHTHAKLHEVLLRYITKDETVRCALSALDIRVDMKVGKSTKVYKKNP